MSIEVLEERTRLLSSFRGLGPPDLCCLCKTETRITGYSEQFFEHHFVLGIDVLDYQSIVSYIHALMESVESSSLLSSSWRVDSATYCCFDLFSGCDIRVHVKVPGIPGVRVTCVAPSGDVSETVPQSVWEGTFLSSYFRYQSSGLNSFKVIPNLDNPRFVPIVNRLIGSFIELSDASGQAVSAPSNVFVHALAKTYLKQYKLAEGMELFASIQSLYPDIVTYIAKIYQLKSQPDAALSVLLRSLRGFPENDHQLILLASIIDNPDLALAASELAIAVGPGNYRAWIFRAQMRKSCADLINALALDDNSETTTENRVHSMTGRPLIMGPGTGIATWLDDKDAATRIVENNSFEQKILTKCQLGVYKVLLSSFPNVDSVANFNDEKGLSVASLLVADMQVVDTMKTELEQRGNRPWLPSHSGLEWSRRADAAHRLENWPMFEIAARMALINGSNLFLAKKLLKLYTNEKYPRESIQVLSQIWNWHRPCPWMTRLVARTVHHFGLSRVRNGVSDPSLVQLLSSMV